MSIRKGKNILSGVGITESELFKKDVVDNLESTDSTLPLSANQGRVLDEKITELEENMSVAEHDHDDRYYTEDEIDEKISTLNTAINEKAPSIHNHNDLYYTESEIDVKLASVKVTKEAVTNALGHAPLTEDEIDEKINDETTRATQVESNLQNQINSKVSSTRKVNGKALSSDITLTASDVGADASGTASSAVNSHNTSASAHNDIRNLITELTTRLNTLANSDDTTLDQMSEVVAYIKNNKTLIDGITTSKVNVTDIINNLTTNTSNKPLSAAQGVALKGLIDTLQTEVNGMAGVEHTHDISDVSGLQSALDGKAASSHGTHVSYSSTAPVMDGTASAGSASTVARSDHKHPTDTSRASASDLSSHTGNTTSHITSTERTNWNSAKSHADSTHAPTTAEKNIIVGIQKNGTDLTVNSSTRKVNVTVPTKVSELTNDLGYLTSQQDISGKLDKTGDASNVTNTFTSASSRTNLTTGEKLSISLGKIMKWFSDLKTVAFSGSYNDLSNKPNIPTKISQLENDSGFKTTDNNTTYSAGTGISLSGTTFSNSGVRSVSSGSTNGTISVNTNGTSAEVAVKGLGSAAYTASSAYASSSHTHSSYANQNAFSNVKVGDTNIAADTTTDTLTLAGSNVTITPDATNDKVTIGITKENVTSALGYTPPTTDTKYTHPSYTAKSSGLYKITVDNTGHVSGVTAVAKSDITALGIPSSDTNTHYTSKNVVNNSTSATANTSTALTNGNVYLVSVENGAATSAHKISGSGATTVTTDASGNIVISSTDTNTTYTLSSFGITATATELNYCDGVTSNIQTQLNGKATSSHTHNYAGSSSAGGSATSAVKLDTATAGSSTQPVYFSGGKPVACTHTLGKSVPSDAKFTDTTYSSLKNPYALTIQGNGTTLSNGTYDGSAAKTVNITPSSIGAAASSHGTHVPSTCTSITDWNSATTTGWYMASGAANAPTTNAWYMGYVVAHNSNYVFQEVYQFTASTDAKAIPKYIRTKMNGTWGSWTNVTVAKAVPSDAKFTDNNTTYGVATTSANGLMSSSDKSKLDGIASGANKTTVDSALSSTSTNPLQNKAVYAELQKYLPIDGRTPLKGELSIMNGCAAFGANENHTVIITYNDLNNPLNTFRSLRLSNSKDADFGDITASVVLEDIVNKVSKPYKLYGEHNINLLKAIFLSLDNNNTLVLPNKLYYNNGYNFLNGDINHSSIISRDVVNTSNSYRGLQILNKNGSSNISTTIRLNVNNGNGESYYQIFGEHNKTTGSYNGNGSTTSRTINTGGIGNICYLIGNGYSMVVTVHGGLLFSGDSTDITKILSSEISFSNGILTIKSADIRINKSGTSYTYQVL